jgi:diacylglycerol kinase
MNYARKRLHSFRFAFKGIADLVSTQPNARIHLISMVAVIAAGFYFKVSHTEWMALIVCIGLVFALEAANTAIEYLTDLVSPDYHPLAGKAKDAAAAAVLLGSIAAVAVGLIIFLPKVSALIHL